MLVFLYLKELYNWTYKQDIFNESTHNQTMKCAQDLSLNSVHVKGEQHVSVLLNA